MSSLLEVVFENVVKSNVIQLLMLLVTSSKRIVNAQCSEDIKLMDDNKLNASALDSVLNFEGDVSALINLQDMRAGRIILPTVLLRLVKYGDQYDIDFNFDSNDIEDVDMTFLMKGLHDHAKEVASKYKVAGFFGGMEPASDEDTRYFTNGSFRPLD